MKVLRVVLAVIFAAALLVFGIWIDIGYFYVGGIEEIVRGAQAVPVSGHDIGWGIVRIMLGGIGTAIAIMTGAGIIALASMGD